MKLIPSVSANQKFAREVEAEVVGKTVTFQRLEYGWLISFGNRFTINVQTIWRVLGSSYICVTSEDDGQQFGLPAPVDAETKANDLLFAKAVEAVEIDLRTADLAFHFAGPLILEVLTTSGGYESWQMLVSQELFAVGANGGLV